MGSLPDLARLPAQMALYGACRLAYTVGTRRRFRWRPIQCSNSGPSGMTRKPADEMTPPQADSPACEPVEAAGSSGEAPALSAHQVSVARAAKAREDRLAAALRTNLARRKAAARAARDGE